MCNLCNSTFELNRRATVSNELTLRRYHFYDDFINGNNGAILSFSFNILSVNSSMCIDKRDAVQFTHLFRACREKNAEGRNL